MSELLFKDQDGEKAILVDVASAGIGLEQVRKNSIGTSQVQPQNW
jgi:hypothetical protein